MIWSRRTEGVEGVERRRRGKTEDRTFSALVVVFGCIRVVHIRLLGVLVPRRLSAKAQKPTKRAEEQGRAEYDEGRAFKETRSLRKPIESA